MQKLLSTIRCELIYGGHLQSIAALSLVVFFATSLGLKINIILAFSIYLASYAIYLNDRISTLKEDFSTNYERSIYYSKIRSRSPYLLSLSLTLALIINYFLGNNYSLIFVFLMMVSGMFYPIYFKKITKNILMFKNIYVGFSFSTLILYVLLLTGVYHERTLIISSILFLYVFINIVALQVLLDIKDTSGDRSIGLKTVSAAYGQKGAIIVSLVLQLVSATLILLAVWLGYLNSNLIFINIPIIGMFIMLVLFNKHAKTIYSLCAIMPLFWMIISLINLW